MKFIIILLVSIALTEATRISATKKQKCFEVQQCAANQHFNICGEWCKPRQA